MSRGPGARLKPPFVLLEDRLNPQRAAQLYSHPRDVILCDSPEGLDAAFARLERELGRGRHVAGYAAYELGYALEPALAALLPSRRSAPLLCFGVFDAPAQITPAELDRQLGALPTPRPIERVRFGHSRAVHMAKVDAIRRLIAAGDLYQANLTFPVRFHYGGDPLALYAAMRTRQPTAHGGYADLGGLKVLSVSPELWLHTSDGRAETRPMKGTTGRAEDPDADRDQVAALVADPKQRAENLMIVDLLRNDLARVSHPGTVRVTSLFAPETYPSFHALTSTITARLRPEAGLPALFAALFPCGSVTGAPKIRAMQVIRELERAPRGVYCGALGALSPDGGLSFNVAIRTAVIDARGRGVYGVGGGIVADSSPAQEYAEARLKARVLCDLASDYELLETFRWSPSSGFLRLDAHLARLAGSARTLGFGYSEAAARAALHTAAARWPADRDQRVRLSLTRAGDLRVSATPLVPEGSRGPIRVGLATARLDPGDPWLRHKTSRRTAHESAHRAAEAAGLEEAVLLNSRDELADGSRHTIFVRRGARLLTPPVASGALPGVLRAELVRQNLACETRLTLDDLRSASAWFLGNSLRGLRRARLCEGAA